MINGSTKLVRGLMLAIALAALAAPARAQTLLAKPYVQPAPAAPAPGDAKLIAWVTDQTPGEFAVEYEWPGQVARAAPVRRVAIDLPEYRPEPKKAVAPAAADTKGDDDDDHEPAPPPTVTPAQHYFKYTAALDGLPPDAAVTYRVRLAGAPVREATFRTRASADKPVRFVAVGDLANGKPNQNAVAYQVSLVKPDFLLVLGDIVYPTGRVSQYMDHFWSTYANADAPSPKAGAPLMATIPFHALLGNHDVDTSLNVFPDALGIYYFFHAPVNGPGPGKWNTPTGRDKAQAAAFRAAAGDSYPALAFHSFDNGPAHFLVLDNSGYVKLDAPEILRWIEADLTASQTRWKFVCLHAPAFHSSPAHYSEQKTRLLVPLLEKLGVDVVFAGHVHNYQRSHPLRFEPAPRKPGEKLVSGKFTLDTTFDGKANTRPNGIVHIVSGGGGGTLYRDPTGDKAAKFMTEKYGPANWVPYTAVHVADRHSFVACDLSPDRLVLRAIDADGKVIDNIVITK
ncbi:MAG: metallophosphoesterase [Phycisphaerae bacterium]